MAEAFHFDESNTISLIPLLQRIKRSDQLAVHGYIREQASVQFQLHIPPSLIDYIILYVFLQIECWNTKLLKHDVANASLTINEETNTITKKRISRARNEWQNVFGTIRVCMNSGIHEWTIKLMVSGPTDWRWVVFGIVPLQIIDNFDETLNRQHGEHWIINGYIGGHALHLGTGSFFKKFRNELDDTPTDSIQYMVEVPYVKNGSGCDELVITMTFDTYKRTLCYSSGGKNYGIAMQEVQEREYSMAVSLLHECEIKLVSYNVTQP